MYFYPVTFLLSICSLFAVSIHAGSLIDPFVFSSSSVPEKRIRPAYRVASDHLFQKSEPLFYLDLQPVVTKPPQKTVPLSKVAQDYHQMRSSPRAVEELKDYSRVCPIAELKELVTCMSDEHFALCYDLLDKRAAGVFWKSLEKRLKQMKGVEKLSAAAQKSAKEQLHLIKQRKNQARSYCQLLNQYSQKNRPDCMESALLSAAHTIRTHERLTSDLEAVERGAAKKIAVLAAEIVSQQIRTALRNSRGITDLPELTAFAQRIQMHASSPEFISHAGRRAEYQSLLALLDSYQQMKRASEETAKVTALGTTFTSDPELLKLRYPTQEQNQIISQEIGLMHAHRTDEFNTVIANASPVIVGLTVQKKTEQAQALIACLRMLGQVCKGVRDEMKTQAKSLVGIPAVITGMSVPLRFLHPAFIPAYAIGAILYYAYANGQELIAHVKGLREAVIQNRPYDIGASFTKVGLDIAGGAVLYQNIHRLFSAALKKGCLDDTVKAVTRGIQDQSLALSPELRTQMQQWTDRLSALVHLYGPDLVNEAQELLHMGYVKGRKPQSLEALQTMIQKLQKLKSNPCIDLLYPERSLEMIGKALVVIAAQEQGYIGDVKYLGKGIFQEESGKLWYVIIAQVSYCEVLEHINAEHAEHLIVDVTECDQNSYATLLKKVSDMSLTHEVLVIDRMTVMRSIHIIETTLGT